MEYIQQLPDNTNIDILGLNDNASITRGIMESNNIRNALLQIQPVKKSQNNVRHFYRTFTG